MGNIPSIDGTPFMRPLTPQPRYGMQSLQALDEIATDQKKILITNIYMSVFLTVAMIIIMILIGYMINKK